MYFFQFKYNDSSPSNLNRTRSNNFLFYFLKKDTVIDCNIHRNFQNQTLNLVFTCQWSHGPYIQIFIYFLTFYKTLLHVDSICIDDQFCIYYCLYFFIIDFMSECDTLCLPVQFYAGLINDMKLYSLKKQRRRSSSVWSWPNEFHLFFSLTS